MGRAKNKLTITCDGDTIRQMPQNYLIAHRHYGGRWVCDPDISADKRLCQQIFDRLFDFDYRYGSAEKLIEGII